MVVAAALFVVVLPSLNSQTASSIPVVTDVAPLAMAESFSARATGGPWSLAIAGGYDTTLGVNLTETTFSISGCPFHGGNFRYLRVPGYNGSYSMGLAEFWLFVYTSTGSTPGALWLVVYDGSLFNVGETNSTGCAPSPALSVPSDVIDSAVAAKFAFSSPQLSSFLRNVTTANVTYALYPTSLNGGPLTYDWLVDATGCDSKGALWNGQSAVNATTGNLSVGSDNVQREPSTECPTGGPPIGGALMLGNASIGTCPPNSMFGTQGCTAGDDTYTVPIDRSSIDVGDFLLGVENASGGTEVLPGYGGFSILSASGHLVALGVRTGDLGPTYLAYGLDGQPGPNATLASGDVLQIDMGNISAPVTGVTLSVYGTYDFRGKIELSLPPISE